MARKKLDEVKKINPDRLMRIEGLKGEVFYDIPKEYINEMAQVFNMQKVVEGLKNSKERAKYFNSFANEVGDKLFELERKYRERTGEVIDFVAEKTGIYFPHVFQRYVEYFYIGTRPRIDLMLLQAQSEN